MMRKKLSLLFAALVMAVMCVNAQVVIGTKAEPHAGAVLDLQSDGINKGLLLPQVDIADTGKFGMEGDETGAAGMLVYNTSDNRVYVWDGVKWQAIGGATTNPDDGSTPMKIGNNTYKTYKYGNTIWMVENSREGADYAAATKYPFGGQNRPDGNTDPDNGYYYTWDNAKHACPASEGWSVPKEEDWDDLKANHVNTDPTADKAKWWVDKNYGAFAGRYNSNWIGWRVHGAWWCYTAPRNLQVGISRLAGISTANTPHWASVRCVKKNN